MNATRALTGGCKEEGVEEIDHRTPRLRWTSIAGQEKLEKEVVGHFLKLYKGDNPSPCPPQPLASQKVTTEDNIRLCAQVTMDEVRPAL